MEASNAQMSLCDDWYDLEGDSDEPMCYLDFLKGAIGIAEDHDPKHEFDPPSTHIDRNVYLVRLWEELEKAVGDMPHNPLGENRDEYDRYMTMKRNAEEAKATEAKAQSMLVHEVREVPGKLHARFDANTGHVLGFQFTAPNMLMPLEYDEQLWVGIRRYLRNVEEISGEAVIAAVWTESTS